MYVFFFAVYSLWFLLNHQVRRVHKIKKNGFLKSTIRFCWLMITNWWMVLLLCDYMTNKTYTKHNTITFTISFYSFASLPIYACLSIVYGMQEYIRTYLTFLPYFFSNVNAAGSIISIWVPSSTAVVRAVLEWTAEQ